LEIHHWRAKIVPSLERGVSLDSEEAEEKAVFQGIEIILQ
jgi:hypothetical protein